MIEPHGSTELSPRYVSDAARRAELAAEAKNLPSLLVNSAAAANAVMLGAGYFNPLTGFQDLADAISIAEKMHTADGLFWPVPVLNLTKDAAGLEPGMRVALRDPNVEGNPVLAVQTIEKIEQVDEATLTRIAEKVFGTLDPKHPGVATFMSLGNVLLSGPIDVLNYSYFEQEFPDTFRTATQIREDMGSRNWETVVAFQTRNPMHRAHEELCRMAKDTLNADGILIHMLLGKLKAGDIPAAVRDASIRKMAEVYFEPNTVLITGYGFDMLYAGPREAVLHAVFRQNAGCTHLIVGRDHAGVGSYYGPFDAQTIFHDEVPEGALKIKIFEADHTAYSKKLNRVVMMRDVPDHTPEDFVMLSGTKVREMLAAGQDLPPEFARPEVARILMKFYQEEAAAGR
ncbi:MAG: sulfate adenylyltransferase [Gammaproteobacteria bacterium]|nr:sulfate adenylyltransferase [Gammaproteobacteria bacterium]